MDRSASGCPRRAARVHAPEGRRRPRFRSERCDSLEGPFAPPPGPERFYYGRCVARITGWIWTPSIVSPTPRGRGTRGRNLSAIAPLAVRTGPPPRGEDTLPAHQGRSPLLLTPGTTEPRPGLLVIGGRSALPWRGAACARPHHQTAIATTASSGVNVRALRFGPGRALLALGGAGRWGWLRWARSRGAAHAPHRGVSGRFLP